MPALPDTSAELSRLLREAAAFLVAGNPAAAMPNALAAHALLVANPDFERDGVAVRWGERIEGLIRNIKRAMAAATGVQRTKYQYEIPEDVDDA